MNMLLIGAGRMGIRHLRGLKDMNGLLCVVDPREEAARDVSLASNEANLKADVRFFTSLEQVPFDAITFDGAILAQTAQGRLESLQRLAEKGIKRLLVEKPIEQSRERFRAILDVCNKCRIEVRCNHYRRSLGFFQSMNRKGRIERIVVTGGAFGLGCNGIHWIDFALYLSGSRTGRLVHGHIEELAIKSGRGPEFRDYGGSGIFTFDSGTELFLSSAAISPVPISSICLSVFLPMVSP